MAAKKRWYVGVKIDYCLGTYSHEAFTSEATPKEDSCYNYVIGPFNTKRGATWAEKYGVKNPHFGCVADAERLARLGVH
jgi:hypothetical protein